MPSFRIIIHRLIYSELNISCLESPIDNFFVKSSSPWGPKMMINFTSMSNIIYKYILSGLNS